MSKTKLRWIGGVDSPREITAFGHVFPLNEWKSYNLSDSLVEKLQGNSEFEIKGSPYELDEGAAADPIEDEDEHKARIKDGVKQARTRKITRVETKSPYTRHEAEDDVDLSGDNHNDPDMETIDHDGHVVPGLPVGAPTDEQKDAE